MKIRDCVDYLSRGKSPKYVDKSNVVVINQACIYWNGINVKNAKYLLEDNFNLDLLLKDGDLLINSTGTGTLGRAAVFHDMNIQAVADSHVTVVRLTKNKMLPEYLKLFLRYKPTQDLLYSRCVNGSTNQIELSKEKLLNFNVPEINIDKQKEIVERFKSLLSIIELRQQELFKYDQFIKARFVELFGTPYGNEKGFPLKSVDDVIEFTGGSQPDKKYFEYEPSEENVRLIQIRDYKNDNYITYIPKHLAKRFCNADDIMIGRYGPPIFQILQGIEGAYNVALMKATPKMGNREFVRYFLKQDCLFNYLDGLSQRTAGQSGIEMPALKAYPFPYPPIELQNQFEVFVKQVDKSKVVIQKSLNEAQLLFDRLMQEYFG